MVLKETKILFNWRVWWRALTFRRKTECLSDLRLRCPICDAMMVRFRNYGLNIEEKLCGIIPYYCKDCKANREDYPVYNVNWRSEEAMALIYFTYLGLIILAISVTLKAII